jgi:hypothetical protein
MIEFLSAIWDGAIEGGYGELRFIRKGEVEQQFPGLPLDQVALPIRLSAADLAGWDVYFGVLPRLRPSGKGDDIDDFANVLWADYDAKSYPGGKPAAFYALGRVQPVPQIIVDSGHGYHAYWLMRRGINWQWATKIMKGIALKTGADRTYDKARILRIPGTHNHKDDPPLLVRLLRFDTLAPRYEGEDFSDYTFLVDREEERSERAIARRKTERVDMPVPIENIPPWLNGLIVNGREDHQDEHPDRSKLCFKTACQLIELGWADDSIETIFLLHPKGIGEKMFEKGAYGHRWLEYTLEAAHRSVGY